METAAAKSPDIIGIAANSDLIGKIRSADLHPSQVEDPRTSLRLCSALHDIVHAFRAAHTNDPLEQRVRRYPLESAPALERQSIELLSSSQIYAGLRRGLRLLPQYPALDQASLSHACSEIQAALVWACNKRNDH